MKNIPTVVRYGISDLERRLAVHRVTIWRRCRAGTFPAPSYVCGRRTWTEGEIAAWEAENVTKGPDVDRGAGNLRNVKQPKGTP